MISILLTIIIPMSGLLFGVLYITDGFPFKWANIPYLGSHPSYGLLLLDAAFWFVAITCVKKFLLDTQKKGSRNEKSLIVVLVLSIVIWFISGIIQACIELFVYGYIMYSFFGAGCIVTGYPFAVCANEFDNTHYVYSIINILFWFGVIWCAKLLLFSKRRGKMKKKRTIRL